MIVPRWILHVVATVSPKVRSNLAVDVGDILRDRGEWAEAAQCYRRALQIRPDRGPIWIQLGHALKENGEPAQAYAAYREACADTRGATIDGDALLFLGTMARRLGHVGEAKVALRRALQVMPDNEMAQTEYLKAIQEPLAVEEPARQAAEALNAAEAVRLDMRAANGTLAIVFDVSDLVSYFRHARLPTGIQRVQIEVVRAALDIHPGIQIACFAEAAGVWHRIPAAHFQTLCGLAGAGGDRLDAAWVEALEILTATRAQAVPVAFAPGAFLVNLGTSWWQQNYFLHLRGLQASCAVRYVPLVHDLIPAIAPHYFVKDLIQDFLGWTDDIFRHVDYFLVNSRSTDADLHRVGQTLGYTVPPSHVCVVPLDADFRRHGRIDDANDDRAETGFALFVSSIEPRKNHALAFRAWQDLIARFGADAVPDLVCVGNRGWLNEHVHAALDADPVLAGKVRMLSGISDERLARLYRDCLFTVYPSSYEGWGLPVTESLCYGKVPVLCRSSSLPEAGGDFALYFEPEDIAGLVAAVEHVAFDATARHALEQRIRDGFRPRTWRAIARQIIDDLDGFKALSEKAPRAGTCPAMAFDTIYRFARNHSARLASARHSGEPFRTGHGWGPRDDSGCSTLPEGGALCFAVAGDHTAVRCWLSLGGPLGHPSELSIHCGSRQLRCDVREGEWRWVSFVAEVIDGEVNCVIRGHDSVELIPHTGERAPQAISAGISRMLLTASEQSRSLLATAHQLAKVEPSHFAFIRDAYLLLTRRPIDEWDLQDHLPRLEAGELSRAQFLETLVRSSEYRLASERVLIFD